jgi:hypothetical protein
VSTLADSFIQEAVICIPDYDAAVVRVVGRLTGWVRMVVYLDPVRGRSYTFLPALVRRKNGELAA